MKTSHALLIAALIFITPFVMAQLKFPDGSVQTTAASAFVSTVIISPVGTPVENGAALKAAYEAIDYATVDEPILVKIEPGIYDLGVDNINLLSYVNLEGSGAESTIIQSALDDAVVGILDHVGQGGAIEIRDLTVKHTGTGSGVGIYNDATMLISDTNVFFTDALVGEVLCVYNVGYLRMRDCEVATGGYVITEPSLAAFGVLNTGACELIGTTIHVNGSGATWAAGVYNASGTTSLRHCVSTAFDATSAEAYGVWGSTNGDDDDILVVAVSELDGTTNYGRLDAANTLRVVGCWDIGFFSIPDFN